MVRAIRLLLPRRESGVVAIVPVRERKRKREEVQHALKTLAAGVPAVEGEGLKAEGCLGVLNR